MDSRVQLDSLGLKIEELMKIRSFIKLVGQDYLTLRAYQILARFVIFVFEPIFSEWNRAEESCRLVAAEFKGLNLIYEFKFDLLLT